MESIVTGKCFYNNSATDRNRRELLGEVVDNEIAVRMSSGPRGTDKETGRKTRFSVRTSGLRCGTTGSPNLARDSSFCGA